MLARFATRVIRPAAAVRLAGRAALADTRQCRHRPRRNRDPPLRHRLVPGVGSVVCTGSEAEVRGGKDEEREERRCEEAAE
jgi:hypothetical protein